MARRVFDSFSTNFFSPLGSIGFLMMRPHLMMLAIVPVVLNLLIFLILVWLGFQYGVAPGTSMIDTRWDWLDPILHYMSAIALSLLVLMLSGLIAFLLIIPIGAPFHDYISDRIERSLLKDHPHLQAPSLTITEGIIHAIKEGVRRVSAELPLILVVFVVSWVPVIGTAIAVTISFFTAAYFLPVDAFSYSMDRRGFSLKQKIGWLRGHRAIWRPFGAGLGLLVLVPCNIIWFPPLAAVAATRMYCETLILEDEEQRGREFIEEATREKIE